MKTGLVKITKYYAHPNADFKNNILINAFPFLSEQKMSELLHSRVAFDPSDLEAPPEVRIQFTKRFNVYFFPSDEQTETALRSWNTLLHSYLSRNPQAPTSQQKFDELLDFLESEEKHSLEANNLLEDPSCITLIGTPGTGKTRLYSALFTRMPQGVLFHPETGSYQLLSIKVNAPGSSKLSLALAVFKALHKVALDCGLDVPRIAKNASAATVVQAIYHLAMLLNLGCLIVDEIQHLARKNSLDKESMEFLTDLINVVKVPIILIGTWKVAGLLGFETRLTRRTLNDSSRLSKKMKNDEEFVKFGRAAFIVQFTKTRVEFNEAIRQRFYHHTQGIADLFIKLYQLVQITAISEGGDEEITITLIDEVAGHHMQLLSKALRIMRDGAAEDDPMMFDLEPTDLASYIEDMANSAALGVTLREPTGKQVPKAPIANALVGGGLASPEVAAQMAGQSVKAHPGYSTGKHISSIIDKSINFGPKPTKVQKRQVETDIAFAQLEDKDVRKVIYLASRTNEEYAEALAGAGLYGPIEEDLPL